MGDIMGNWDRRFEGVATTLAASLEAGTDVGASVAVLLGGEPVVDIWGGFVDESHSAPRWPGTGRSSQRPARTGSRSAI